MIRTPDSQVSVLYIIVVHCSKFCLLHSLQRQFQASQISEGEDGEVTQNVVDFLLFNIVRSACWVVRQGRWHGLQYCWTWVHMLIFGFCGRYLYAKPCMHFVASLWIIGRLLFEVDPRTLFWQGFKTALWADSCYSTSQPTEGRTLLMAKMLAALSRVSLTSVKYDVHRTTVVECAQWLLRRYKAQCANLGVDAAVARSFWCPDRFSHTCIRCSAQISMG